MHFARPVAEADAVMGDDQVADRPNLLSRSQTASGLLLLQAWPHLDAIVLSVIQVCRSRQPKWCSLASCSKLGPM